MSLIVLGLAIGLDNCLVGAALGPLQLEARRRRALAVSFGLFETLMPLLGATVGRQWTATTGAHEWGFVAPLALALCALLVFFGARGKGRIALQSRWTLVLLPLCMSFDNLAAGIAVIESGAALVPAALGIGALAGILSLLGLHVGARAADFLSARPSIVCGTLLAIGSFATLVRN